MEKHLDIPQSFMIMKKINTGEKTMFENNVGKHLGVPCSFKDKKEFSGEKPHACKHCGKTFICPKDC